MKPRQYPWKYVKTLGQSLLQNLKERSSITLRIWTYQCEYIMAQRFRRGIQITVFYHRIWGENGLKKLLCALRKHAQKHIKSIALSSVGVYIFDWDAERIQYDSIQFYFNEIDYVKKLKQETLMCRLCNKRRVMTEKFDGIEYCTCAECNKVSKSENGWEPYIERKDMIIWRREEKSSLFAYKMHVTYKDVTADDFLHVQTDVEYRKHWDDTAISLEIVDTDPVDTVKSHVIYWEMRWPRLFANRDYVYNRRHFVDTTRNLIVICNKSTVHPKCPIKPEKQRVENYWSYMVIRPFSSFKKPGLEFVLTYFDDPGLALPSTITSWVAQKQMPEFLNKLYLATKRYAAEKQHYPEDAFGSWENFKSKPHVEQDKEKYRVNNSKDKSVNEDEEQGSVQDGLSTTTDVEESKKHSWWSYLHLQNFFA